MFATALRLGTLYANLKLASKSHEEYEMIRKLLDILEAAPSSDFGSVHSRIEDATNTRGISYDEATTWIGHRQSILDSRAAVAAIVPRSRPVYKADVQPDISKSDTSASSSAQSDCTIDELQQMVQVYLSTQHRKNPRTDYRKSGTHPPGRPPCPQTPVLFLRREAAPCRVDGCTTPSLSRLCEEHALQLVSKKAQSLVCTTSGVQRHAYYAENPAVDNKPAWRGILIRDAAAQLDANGPAKPH
jgi:hypothetical protein